VLDHQYRGGLRAFERCAPISSALRFAPEGLVLDAGTVLLRADGPRRLQSPKGCEARLLALLSAAYGRSVDPTVLGNIERPPRPGTAATIASPTSTWRMRASASCLTRTTPPSAS
jgi:hypothetical protein